MDTLDKMTLGGRVRYFRKLRNITQVQLAEMVDTNQQQITSIEKDAVKNPRNLEAIADALGVPATLLRYGIIAVDECHTVSITLAGKIDKLSDDDRQLVESLVDKLLNK